MERLGVIKEVVADGYKIAISHNQLIIIRRYARVRGIDILQLDSN